jgi:acetyltransferase-like isoleucine patch superfamily enzyme
MASIEIPGVRTFEHTKIIGLEHIRFGSPVVVDDFVFIYATNTVSIGNYVHIGAFSSIAGGGPFLMEDFSGLSMGVRIVTGSDDFKGAGFGNPTVPRRYRNVHVGSIRIGKFAIVGANSVILPDVEIGEGAAVGAGSVVSKSLEPWGIYVGNRKVGERDRDGMLANYASFLAEGNAQEP